jgi:hypothetical protein
LHTDFPRWLRERAGKDAVLSSFNAAYNPKQSGTDYVITINACALEDARDHSSHIVQLILDYQNFFDTIVRGIVFVVMKGKGIPDKAIRFSKKCTLE